MKLEDADKERDHKAKERQRDRLHEKGLANTHEGKRMALVA